MQTITSFDVELEATVDGRLDETSNENTSIYTSNENTGRNTSLSTSSSRSSSAKRKSDTKYEDAINKILELSKSPDEDDDMFSAFAKSISLQLKQLPIAKACSTMSEIQSLVSQRICENLASSNELPRQRILVISDKLLSSNTSRSVSCSSQNTGTSESSTIIEEALQNANIYMDNKNQEF